MRKVFRICRKLFFCVCILLMIIPGFVFSVFAYPLHLFNKPLCIRISTFFSYTTWLLTSMILRISIRVEGKNILRKENYLVISNHLGSIDFMLMGEIARERGMLAHLKYAIKESVQFIPVFYQVMIYLGFLVLKRNFDSDQIQIINHFGILKRSKVPMWFVLYPEGSRFTEKLREASIEYSYRKRMVKLENVLFPRYKGFKLICEQLRGSEIKNIADITFFYNGGEVPPLWKILFGDLEGSFNYDIRIVPIDEIEDYEEFLYKSFERKDALISEWKSK